MTAPVEDWVRVVTQVMRVHDGDTYLFEVDQGCGDRRVAWYRLHNLDTWELDQPLGTAARDFCVAVFDQAKKITIQTFKTAGGEDKTSFIRYVADVWVDDELLANMLQVAGYKKEAT